MEAKQNLREGWTLSAKQYFIFKRDVAAHRARLRCSTIGASQSCRCLGAELLLKLFFVFSSVRIQRRCRCMALGAGLAGFLRYGRGRHRGTRRGCYNRKGNQ